MDGQQSTGTRTTGGFSPGVEGLRGIAILLVVAFHALPGVTGGFVGVDVFFVISGFLITGLLVRELRGTGRIDLLGFYARRLRRLLPAAIVVGAIVLPFAWLSVSPLDRPGLALDGGAAMLIVSNLRFAAAQGDYFTAVAGPSPFLHYWSLSLEEQFYLVWPGLLLVVTRWGHVRVAASVTLAGVAVAGLAVGVLLTEMAPSWAFYSLPSRAWEFALGGLLAVLADRAPRVPATLTAVAGWTGAAMIALAVVVLDGSVPYPGLAATLPSVGALLVIASVGAPAGPALVLACGPLRFLGRISYSLYLWHWPLLAIPAAASGSSLDWPAAVALSGAAVVLAWITWRFVEEPFRRAPRGRPHLASLSLRLGSAAVAGSVLWVGLFGLAAEVGLTASASSDPVGPAAMEGADAGLEALVADAGQEALGDDTGPVGVLGDADDPEAPAGSPASAVDSPSGPPSDDGQPSASAGSPAAGGTAGTSGGPTPAAPGPTTRAPDWTTIPDRDLPAGVRLPARVMPSLQDARGDIERLWRDGCFTGLDGREPASCVYGDRNGRLTVVLIGDSHAAHWFPALNVLANRFDWRLVPLAKASCPFVDIEVLHPFVERAYDACSAWRARAIRAANAAHPDLVIVATAYRGIRPVDGTLTDREKGEAMAAAIGRLQAPVAVMIDNPRTDTDLPACLSRHPDDIHRCALSRSEAFPKGFGVIERTAARLSAARLIDLSAAICPSLPCPVVRDGMILYRDGHHLTATFVRSLAPALREQLLPILEPATPTPAATPTPVATPGATPVVTPAPSTPSTSPAVAPASGLPSAPADRPSAVVGTTATVASLRLDTGVVRPGDAAGGVLEPIVATHPTDPRVMAVAFERRLARPGCSGAILEAGLAVSTDGGRTWRAPAGVPWAGSGRVSSYHSAVAWGPGPRPATQRLYWAGTTTLRCGGDLRVATAWSDDLGRTWSRLSIMRGTPAWVGGVPDITTDRNPASPGYGTVWLAYNFPAASGRGSGLEVLASRDHGRTWRGVSVPRAPAPAAYPSSWRFAYRIRTAPDGAAYVSWYQADLRRWWPEAVFERGGRANVGRIGFGVARVWQDGRRLRTSPPVLAVTVPENAWTLGDRPAIGTHSHTYADPMWAHGLAVDPASGVVHLAVARYGPTVDGTARGRVIVARSDDRGRTWTLRSLPAVPSVDGVVQSSWRPGIVARNGVVVVAMRTLDDLPAGQRGADARIGTAWCVSSDGGRTFASPVLVPGSRWRASRLGAAVNGPGVRERVELAADGAAVIAYGDGRGTRGSSVRVAVVALADPAPAPESWPMIRGPR